MLFHRVGTGLLLLGAVGAACGQGKLSDPIVVGYVTAVAADGGFSVMGVPVRVTAKTKITLVSTKNNRPVDKVEAPYLGEPLSVWGKFDKKAKVIHAEFVHVEPPEPAKIAGKAMIDKTLDAATPGGDQERMIRADGFPLKLTAATKMHYNEPLSSLKDVGTNQWITYTGVQGLDGVVLVDEAEVWNNRVDPDEAKLKKGKEFDPAAVKPADQRALALRQGFFGVNEKLLPPHEDAELQARVVRIGQSMIPAYQKALPDTDPTKINFRFSVVDSALQLDGWGLASGIVEVPFPAVSRLTTDNELAALLADHIATVIEKQALMNAPANFRLTTAKWASLPASVVLGAIVPLPFLGTAAMVGSGGVVGSIREHIETLAEQQSGRVGLCLMKDAGYDLSAAPTTWWLLATRKPKPVEEVEIPDRSADLYRVMGTTWRGRLE